MKPVDRRRFGIGAGRKRPAYKPKDIHCKYCGAPLEQKDEHSELVVCDHCGSHLDVSEEEMVVLGAGPRVRWKFPLKIGDSYRHKGARFEVIARMAFTEDSDDSELTRQYLLYNPRRGTMWLDEYKGSYSISTDTHIMPEADPFTEAAGFTMETRDGQEWVREEVGTYVLVYVDGALPWIAKKGDWIKYAEFSEKSGSGKQYEVQVIQGEMEFGMGEAVPVEVVRKATGKPTLEGTKEADLWDAAKTRKWYVSLMKIALFALVLNGIIAAWASSRSSANVVLYQSFEPSELSGEALSEPFRVADPGNIVKITVRTNLDNAWMALDLAIVREDDKVVHVTDSDMQYYHGRSGGESWSEGSRWKAIFIRIPEAGFYRVLLHAVSARGNARQANTAIHGLSVRVNDGAKRAGYPVFAAVASGIILVLLGFYYLKELGYIEEEDDDDDDW